MERKRSRSIAACVVLCVLCCDPPSALWAHQAAFLTRHLSVGIDPDELMATSGNSLALGMVCTALKQSHQDATGQNTYVAIVEQPTYFLAGSIFKSSGVPCVGAQCDSEGIIVRGDAGLEGAVARSMAVHGVQPSMIYTIPIFQNPLGVTMSRARAEELVSYAEEHGMVIIADEPYPLLQYESGGAGGKQLRTLMELDRGRGIIASLGSYSKILSPGLRCGWIHAAPVSFIFLFFSPLLFFFSSFICLFMVIVTNSGFVSDESMLFVLGVGLILAGLWRTLWSRPMCAAMHYTFALTLESPPHHPTPHHTTPHTK